VFETVLVAGGAPVALDDHLARLSASVSSLYGRELPPLLADELLAAARDAGEARLRVNVTPGPFAVEFELTPLAPRTTPVTLLPRAVPGGLGAHKWIDRRLLDSLAEEAGRREPLLCDLDGLVLESARGNVFCVEAGRGLVTPPLDGRILPGITRARVLGAAARLGIPVTVEPLSLERLHRAEEILVSGSLGGVELAQLGGVELAPLGEAELAQLRGRPGPDAASVGARLAAMLAPTSLVPA
jgi:para-aminobenzoate synthetase/4-amino-4-deoxychorismate lyase